MKNEFSFIDNPTKEGRKKGCTGQEIWHYLEQPIRLRRGWVLWRLEDWGGGVISCAARDVAKKCQST